MKAAPRARGATQGGRESPRHGRISVNHRSSHDADAAGPGRGAQMPAPTGADEFDAILQKLKLLEFGLYGLQQYGRSAPLDVEDLGPFYRLAEEIQGDVLALQERLVPQPMAEPAA